jgi:hypothetical protein
VWSISNAQLSKDELLEGLPYHKIMNTTKHDRKTAAAGQMGKSTRVATRLVQKPMVIGKRRLTEAQRRAILDAMLKAA